MQTKILKIKRTGGGGRDLLKSIIFEALSIYGIIEDEKPVSTLMSVNQVMSLFGISRATLSRWTKSGKLKPVRMSYKKVYFRQSDIQKLTTLDSDEN